MIPITGHRINSLDYLRGFMACAVMAYHYSTWTFGNYDSTSILTRIGLYGVSFFYILSGLTLSVVYEKYPLTFDSLLFFSIKRIFRIYPLLWLVTFVYIFSLQIDDSELILLNLSGWFGFVRPHAYIGTGVWSIGNELFFYSTFPLLMFFKGKFVKLFFFLIAIGFLIGWYYSNVLIKSSFSLESQWALYVSPLNQFYLFAGGVLIGHLVTAFKIFVKSFIGLSIIVMLVFVFCFYPTSGDSVGLVTGNNRIVFSMICFLVCFLVFVVRIDVSGIGHHFFSFLGETSYSIYLLHPIAFSAVKKINVFTLNFSPIFELVLSIAVTLISSFLCYRFLEKPMIKLGKVVLKKLNPI